MKSFNPKPNFIVDTEGAGGSYLEKTNPLDEIDKRSSEIFIAHVKGEMSDDAYYKEKAEIDQARLKYDPFYAYTSNRFGKYLKLNGKN
jgi:hypothetical protein